MNQEAEQKRRKAPPKVVIFGAGITGLTAAHELVERGWDVTVVEKALDPLNIDECAIGGLAKTQWAVYQAPNKADGPAEALPMVPTVRLRIVQGKLKAARAAAKLPQGTLLSEIKSTLGSYSEQKLKDILDIALDDGSKMYLARVGVRLVAIRPFAPKLSINYRKGADEFITECLSVYLRRLGAPDEIGGAEDSSLPQPVWQIETDLFDDMPGKDFPTRAGDFSGILPGEHGFRFFPAFYRNVFDTLRRIPVRGEGQNFGDVYRTVYDNLVPTEANWLALDNKELRPHSETAAKRDVVRFPRRLRKSLREGFDSMNDMQTELGYTARDIELLKLRLFKYMTSCQARRKEQYQRMKWSDFMGISDLSPACEQDMRRAPQLLAAMTAEESDARTQGNVATQLLLDPVNADEHVDSTLNGPTTVAWFAPWRDYLISQGVRFIPGALERFSNAQLTDGKVSYQVVRPVLKEDPGFDSISARVKEADYYILALPVQAWSNQSPSLVASWRKARGVTTLPDHIDRLKSWLDTHVEPIDAFGKGPLYKGLTGVQLYFDSDDMPRSGHTLFMDSPWRLSSISQASFWNRRRESIDCYRGIVSVDIGSFETGSDDDQVKGSRTKPVDRFINVPRDELHSNIWAQIHHGYSAYKQWKGPSVPYTIYRIDEYLKYDNRVATNPKNLAPFLINGIKEWDDRPGWYGLPEGKEPSFSAAEVDSDARYQLMPNYPERQGAAPATDKEEHVPEGVPRWVLAGTFMQTWTRATTMESANESARHAVNTLLEDARKRHGRQAELCRIWNPEKYEHPDLRIWQELDQKLYEAGEPGEVPHMLDILDLDAISGALLETSDPAGFITRFVEKGAAK